MDILNKKNIEVINAACLDDGDIDKFILNSRKEESTDILETLFSEKIESTTKKHQQSLCYTNRITIVPCAGEQINYKIALLKYGLIELNKYTNENKLNRVYVKSTEDDNKTKK